VQRHRLVERFFVAKKEFSSQAGYAEVLTDPEAPTELDLDLIYSSQALVTRIGPNGRPSSSTSMPGLVAQMLELLRLESGQRVLEIGAGTGYNAALISEIVGSQQAVVAVDIQEDVIEQTARLLKQAGFGEIKLVVRDGFFGVAEEAPFDRIVATVGLFDVSPHWTHLLLPDGEMLLPVYQGGAAPLLRVRKEGGSAVGRVVGTAGFMAIQGEMRPDVGEPSVPSATPPEPVERVPGWSSGITTSERWHFWFFVTASDRRGSLLAIPGHDDGYTWRNWTFGLAEGASNAIIDGDDLVLVGDPGPLVQRLEALRSIWESQGRAKASDFEIEFVSKESYAGTQNDLAIERKYHYQVLRLVV
jgi:protein-L-isoaspartate(D-aspartate) O-methyltransferase